MAPSPASATLLLCAELNLKSGAVQPAIEEPERFLAHQPKAAPALVLPGSTHLARREPARATEVYRRLAALAMAPGFVDPVVHLIAPSFPEKRPDQALARARKQAALLPKSAVHRFLVGEALEINPKNVGALRPGRQQPARVLFEHGGDKDKALTLAQTAKELVPEDPQVSDTLGWILYQRGVHQRALALLKDSAARLPANPMIHYHLRMVSAQLGGKDAARQALSIAAAAPTPSPGQDEAKKALAALK